MTQVSYIPDAFGPAPLRTWGFWAIVTGALAVMVVCFYIYGPTLEPQPSAAQQIGEIAGEMKRAAWRAFLGMEAEAAAPAPEPSLFMRYLPFAGPALGLVAVVLSAVSLIRREDRKLAGYGVALGGGAVLFQVFWWFAALIVCAILFVKIIENLDGFFSLPWD
ncbi:hypothetical protein BD830_106327 [Maritimibacter alkaliphilus HTCC2654]|uniref:Uncharacterized protein n=1 Tax=Maritimibacter alkaliphilus HTCC2654 TaxID=314271 RepID=A3VA06_9RHOB|nr:hypothetical protein [Maritimibacter alkaliphilus]EAQ14747.1 hypothetical protein RB2654_19228 [Maritimibacter alkaliphilus HTCC2654]TYP81024.1 hypothetical protein BD830_106327 [Maritimibacter alkaliphilus HTCC2654]